MNNEFNNINPNSNVANYPNNNQNGYMGPVVTPQPTISAVPQYNGPVSNQNYNNVPAYPQNATPTIQAQPSYPQPTPVQVQSYAQQSQTVQQPTMSYQQTPQIQATPQMSYPQTVQQQQQVTAVQASTYQQMPNVPVLQAGSQMPQNVQPSVPTSYQQTSVVTQPTYPQSATPTIQAQPSYPQVTPVQTQSYAQQLVQPTIPSVPQVTELQISSQQMPVSTPSNSVVVEVPTNINMGSGINEPSIFNNNQLPVQFSSNTDSEDKSGKKSLKDKLSVFKSKKFIILLIILIIVILGIIFGINKLLSGSFGHGYSVEDGNKLNINETTANKTKYKFSAEIKDTKEIVVGKTKYIGYKLAITNTGSSKLKLDGFDVEFTLTNNETGEITSTTVFLSNTYMLQVPEKVNKDLLPLEVPRGKTVEGYIYFKTTSDKAERLDINIYRNYSGKKTTYSINFKQVEDEDDEEEEEPVEEDEEVEEVSKPADEEEDTSNKKEESNNNENTSNDTKKEDTTKTDDKSNSNTTSNANKDKK